MNDALLIFNPKLYEKLDELQNALIEQHNTIQEILELVDKYMRLQENI